MKTTVISRATARSLDYLLTTHETPARAAHDCDISLRSIAPYRDSRLERVRDILRRLERATPESLERQRATIRRIAAVEATS
jgi:hypothetical protein